MDIKYTRGKHPNSRKGGFKRKYIINESCFDVITDESSYWAGFIAADGSITPNKKFLSFGLQLRDRDMLEKLNNFMGSNYPIRSGFSSSTNKQGDRYPYVALQIMSENICLKLEEIFNITPRKSLTLMPPNLVQESHIDSFIKGYIDGDGSIGIYGRHNMRISAMGTFEMCSWILSRLSRIYGKNITCMRKVYKANVFSFHVCSRTGRYIFMHFYKIKYGMNRKWLEEYYDYCKNWVTKRYDTKKYIEIFNLSKTHTNAEIGKMRGCTASNIGMLKSSKNYKHFISNLQ